MAYKSTTKHFNEFNYKLNMSSARTFLKWSSLPQYFLTDTIVLNQLVFYEFSGINPFFIDQPDKIYPGGKSADI